MKKSFLLKRTWQYLWKLGGVWALVVTAGGLDAWMLEAVAADASSLLPPISHRTAANPVASPPGEAAAEDPGLKPSPAAPPEESADSPSSPLPPSKPTPSAPSALKAPAPEAPEPPGTTESIQKLFESFLQKPTGENYLKLLDALCRHPAYNPYSTELEDTAQLLQKRQYEEAKAVLDKAMPNLLLSPRAHNYYRVIAEAAGDAQEVQRRDQIAQKCLQGIQATGRGLVEAAAGEPKQDQVPTAPFHVARVSDEYDLIRVLGKRARVISQSLRRIDDRWYDVLRCSDETGNVFYVWFDVTRPISVVHRQIRQSTQQEKKP